MAFTSMTFSRATPVGRPSGTGPEAPFAPCSTRPDTKVKAASPLKKALHKPLRCVKAAAATLAARVQPCEKDPVLEVNITDVLHPAAYRMPANPMGLDICFRPPSRAWALACAKKGGRLPGNFEVELEDRLLAAHKYGTGLLQGGVPEHLRYQWSAANKLMACTTPTQLAHAIAAQFPHSTYAEIVQPEQRKAPSPTYRPASRKVGSHQSSAAHAPQPPTAGDQSTSPALAKAAGAMHYSVCVITGSVRAVEALPPLTASPSASQQASPVAAATPQQGGGSPAASAGSSLPSAGSPLFSAASRDSSPSSSQISSSSISTQRWRQRTASGLSIDVSPVPWGSRSRFAEMRAGGVISPPAEHPCAAASTRWP